MHDATVQKFCESRSFAEKYGTGMSETPVKILRSSLDDFCRVCNVNLRLSGQEKFNLFEGETSRSKMLLLDYPPCWEFLFRKNKMHPRGCGSNGRKT